jgi:hypothetical protein
MDARLRQLVRERAGHRCEYCRVPQAVLRFALQIEHIVARQHLGGNAEDNLALACDRCNLHKGPNLSGIDPGSGELTRLFDPRRDVWNEHFELRGNEIVGLSPIGRATVGLLQFNTETRMRLRAVVIAAGHW